MNKLLGKYFKMLVIEMELILKRGLFQKRGLNGAYLGKETYFRDNTVFLNKVVFHPRIGRKKWDPKNNELFGIWLHNSNRVLYEKLGLHYLCLLEMGYKLLEMGYKFPNGSKTGFFLLKSIPELREAEFRYPRICIPPKIPIRSRLSGF